MNYRSLRRGLLATTAICGAIVSVLALAAAPAIAQDTPPASDQAKPDDTTTVVVTGSILRKKNLSAYAPLQTKTSVDLEQRGLTTVANAVQNLSGNNAGALPNSFTANGAFAAGASGASLRGLLTSNTLTLMDGMRPSYYPLADDGSRNFVDLNTIPDVVVDRIEVLQDGASSTYGADAIAGVINVITKKQINGFLAKAEYGVSEKGDAAAPFVSAAWGTGNLNTDGWNFYVAGEYQHDDVVYNRQRGFPYNTGDLRSLCAPSLDTDTGDWGGGTGIDTNGMTCGSNNNANGLQFDNTYFGISTFEPAPMVREANAGNTAVIPGATWHLLNPTLGCAPQSKAYTVTQEQLDNGGVTSVADGTTLCETDIVHQYGVITPEDTRYSVTAHLAKRFGDNAEAWLEANYYQNKTFYMSNPVQWARNAPPVLGVTRYLGNTLALPVYICPRGTVTCTSANGQLNPNNPFAASGHQARIQFADPNMPTGNGTLSKTVRLAGGITGVFGDDWDYDVGFSAMQTDLDVTGTGYLYIQHVLDVIADGSYNFIDPSKNSQAVRDYVAPEFTQKAKSQTAMIQANVSKDVMDLAGGPLQVGVGVAVRYEMIDDPSANPFSGGFTQGYHVINPFFSKGQRTVSSAYFEAEAPIFTRLDLNLSGRYDSYSSGQSNFSPKIGAKYRITDKLMLRGTFSKGFRIPSIAEVNSQTTGYVTVSAPDSFLDLHGNNGYGKGYSLGITTVGSPDLKPEKSENTQIGFVFVPNKTFSFSFDYYRIEKTSVIGTEDSGPALDAYYAGEPIPPGFSIVSAAPDLEHPDLLPYAAFVLVPFANLGKQSTSGLDLTASVSLPLGPVKWTSTAEGSYIGHLNQDFGSGTQHYAGTLGPYVITSASGTPQWRANWSNTFAYGNAKLTATAYYTDGYEETAEDIDGTKGDCPGSAADTGVPTAYDDGVTPIVCNVKPFIVVDMHASYDITPNYTIYADVENLLGADAPFDPTTYGGVNYNPAWANSGVIGRYYKLGIKAKF